MVIVDIDVAYAESISLIIESYQRQTSNIAQLNWNLEAIIESLKSGRAMGLLEGNEKTSQSTLLAFIIYRDMQEIAEILLLGSVIDRQRQGLMGQLLAHLKFKYQEIWLEVHEENERAVEFYKKQKFLQDGKRPKYYTDFKAALVMSWKRGIAF